MNIKILYAFLVSMLSFASFASKPASTQIQLHEEIIERNDEDEVEVATNFYVSPKENAEQVGRLLYTFKKKSKIGMIDIIEVYKGFRNAGLGSAWFKRAVIGLTAYNPKSICWEALPLDYSFSRKDLASLVRLYKRLDGVVIKEHIDNKHNYVEMQYPIALAYAFSILHPIFLTQEISPALENKKIKTKDGKPYIYKQKDPFALIVAYANIDLKNTDLKTAKPEALLARAAPANTLLQEVDSASIELL